MSFRMMARLRILSSSATSSALAPVSGTLSSHSWIFGRLVSVRPWPRSVPSKCSTTLWATQIRSPTLSVCRVWASEGITPIDHSGNGIGILVVWPINSGHGARAGVLGNFNNTLAFLSYCPHRVQLVFDHPVGSVPLSKELDFSGRIHLRGVV